MSLSDFSVYSFVCYPLLLSICDSQWASSTKPIKNKNLYDPWTSVTTDMFYCSEVKMISHCTTASFFFSSRMKLSCILLFCSNNARFYASPLFPLCSPLLPSFHSSILPSFLPSLFTCSLASVLLLLLCPFVSLLPFSVYPHYFYR